MARKIETLDDLTGAYGQSWETGILSENRALAERHGYRVHEAANGAAWVTGPRGGRAVRVVCSELIWVDTEDGRIDGRCGLPVADGWACSSHAAELAEWRAMSDREQDSWERLRASWTA
jgi:hypothetical protein